MTHRQLEETGIKREEMAQGHFLRVVRDHVLLPDGTTGTREYVVHPGAVMIIPLLDDGRVVLERQFRYPVGQAMVEFPAGKLDAGEPSLQCAMRELTEETGYVAREWSYAGRLHPLVAYSTEHIDVWFARGLTPGAQQLDPGEFLEVFDATLEELMTWCRNGVITDAKTLIGTLWLQNTCAGTWPLEWLPAESSEFPQPSGPFQPTLTKLE